MLMVCHHLNPAVPEDLAFAESRIRPSTMAAEDLLHDLGRDLDDRLGLAGDGPGRRGRPAHLADRARDEGPARRAARRRRRPTTSGPGATSRSTRSARRSRTAWTSEVGSVEAGKLADLVLWDPAFFGVRPHAGHQGRHDRVGADGRRQRLDPDPAADAAPARCSARTARCRPRRQLAFVAPAAIDAGLADRLGVQRRAGRRSPTPARSARPTCRCNDALPRIEVEPDTFTVRIDGEVVEPDPVDRAADGPALLPVLMHERIDRPAGHAAAAGRRPAAGRRARALRRAGGGGRGRAGRATSTTWTASCAAGCHRRPGRGRVRGAAACARPGRRWAGAGRRRRLDARTPSPALRRGLAGPGPGAAAGRPGDVAAAVAGLGPRTAASARRARRGRRGRRADPPAGGAGRRATARSPGRPAPRSGCSGSTRTRCTRCWPGSPPTATGSRPTAAAPVARDPVDDLPAAGAPAARHRRRAPRHLGGASLCILNTRRSTRPRRTRTAGRGAAHPSGPGRRPARAAAAGPRALRIGIGGPVGSGKTALVAALCRALRRRAAPGRGDQRHLHHRGRRLPAAQRRPAGRADPRGGDRLLPAHRDPRRHLGQPRRRRGPGGDARPARPGAGRERRRQPDRHVQQGPGRPADLRGRRGRRRQGAAQGRPRRHRRRPAGHQQDRPGPAGRRRPRR